MAAATSGSFKAKAPKAPQAPAKAQAQFRAEKEAKAAAAKVAAAAEAAEAEAVAEARAATSPPKEGEVQQAQAASEPGKAARPKAAKASQWFWLPPGSQTASASAEPPASGAAAAAAAEQEVPEAEVEASNVDSSSMTLDEILKLFRKGQVLDQADRDGKRESVRNTNQSYDQESEVFNGPPRLRRWFGRQNNYRTTISNSSKPRAFPSITRRIPLDRNNAASENGNSESTARQFKNPNSRPERLGRQLTLGPARKAVPSDAGRTIKQKQQRENKVNQNRGIPPRKVWTTEVKSPSKSRFQVQIKPRLVLKVSVANPQVSQKKQFKRTDGETSFQMDKWNAPKTEKFQPKGICLRYNFRAVANQTKITLNERFSGLKIIKQDFKVTKPGNRTVTLP